MYAVRVIRSSGYFETVLSRLRAVYTRYYGHHVPEQVVVELWRHKGDDERYVLTLYSRDERLQQLALSVLGYHNVEFAQDIDRWVDKERGPLRRSVVGQMRLSV
ncbi:MAG: hypothetical protein QXP81_09055 [Nitrososphaerota archaeon]